MNDMDILIEFEQIPAAIEVLKKLGFTSVGAIFEQKEISKHSHHTPPYISPDLNCVIGLHWGLSSPHAPFHIPTSWVWPKIEEMVFQGVRTYRLSWTHNLLHLCVHLPFYKTGLRELADVYNVLIAHASEIDWQEFEQVANDLKIVDPVYRVLTLANSLQKLNLPSGLLKRLGAKASCLTLSDTLKRRSRPSLILHSRCVLAAKIEKAFVFFRLSRNEKERMKAFLGMWSLLLNPPAADLAKVAGLTAQSSLFERLWARLTFPIKMWRALQRDHGVLGMLLSTSYNFVIFCYLFARQILLTLKIPGIHAGASIKDHPGFKLLKILE